MIAVRLHPDPAESENGALRVVPGSHRLGRLTAEEIARVRSESGEVTSPVGAGGAMLLFPLLLHASSASSLPARRRVLHLEYSALDLPAGLGWATA